MASYDSSRHLADGTFFGGRLPLGFPSLLGRLAAWNDARVTRNALEKLSDHELHDLGLSRGDIDRISEIGRR